MEEKIKRAIVDERISLRRFEKAITDGMDTSYYSGRINGSKNCIRRLEWLLKT
jgi:hypothetical protein